MSLNMRRTSGIPLLTMFVVVMSGAMVTAAEEDHILPSPRSIYLIALPIMGSAVLLINTLPSLFGRPYRREPAAFHLANILTLSSVICLITVILVTNAIQPGVDTTISLATIGVLGLLIIIGLFVRYLLLPIQWATIAGGAIATLIVLLAYMAMETPQATVDRLDDLLSYLTPLWLLIFVGLLLLETARYHVVVNKEPDWPRVPKDRRMLRLGELLIMNMAVVVGVAVTWFS